MSFTSLLFIYISFTVIFTQWKLTVITQPKRTLRFFIRKFYARVSKCSPTPSLPPKEALMFLRLMSEAGLSLDLTTTGTCVASAITTLMIGIWANLPLGCAPGIGLTAYFTYGLVGDNVSPENALAASFLSGVVCLLFSVSVLSDRLLKCIYGQDEI